MKMYGADGRPTTLRQIERAAAAKKANVKTEHTLEPWEVREGKYPDGDRCLSIISCHPSESARPIAQLGNNEGRDRQTADAWLIVTAVNALPDLLAACELLIDIIRKVPGVMDLLRRNAGLDDAVKEARAAIAKAKGE